MTKTMKVSNSEKNSLQKIFERPKKSSLIYGWKDSYWSWFQVAIDNSRPSKPMWRYEGKNWGKVDSVMK